MKFFTVLIVLCIFCEGFSQQINSLSLGSLISPQMDFFEDMCYNRTENANVFQQLKQTFEKCQSMIFNGNNLTLTYDTLVHKDPREFYDFYTSWVETEILTSDDEIINHIQFASLFDDDLHLSLLDNVPHRVPLICETSATTNWKLSWNNVWTKPNYWLLTRLKT